MSIELKELKPMIQQWGKEKGITNHDKQMLKLFEELGETAGAILRDDEKEVIDSLGDVYIVIAILENINEMVDSDSLIYEFYQVIRKCAIGSYEESYKSLIKICAMQNKDLASCVRFAWDEIKDRKGKTVDGGFIKESDLN